MKQRNTHTIYSVICGHDKSAPTVGARGVNVGARWCTWVNITCSWNKHWLYINNRSIHSVGVGADSSCPFVTNYVNTTTYHNGYSRINIGCTRLSTPYIP